MNPETIREAIGYAEGWGINRSKNVTAHGLQRMPIELLTYSHKAALAARLVEQIDAGSHEVISSEGHCAIYDQENQVNIIEVNSSFNRTENTINACVEFYRGDTTKQSTCCGDATHGCMVNPNE